MYGGYILNIIIKFIIKSIFEKKFRTFIIIFSVTLSSALFFASSGLSGSMSSMYETQIKMQTGRADLIVVPNRESPSNTFKLDYDVVDDIEFVAGDISVSGSYKLNEKESKTYKTKSEKLYIRGFDLNELEKLNPINFSQKAVGKNFEGNCVILSKIFADKYNYNVGDRINIEINNRERIMTVWGISRPTGIFQHSPQSDSMTVLIPIDTLSSYFNVRGRVQTAYIVLKEGAEIESVKERLIKQYDRYTVREPFTADEINDYMQFITVPLYLMTSMVMFISIFIIYSTFKVITVERIPVIGTFRSIGATKRMTDGVLIGESLTYGIIGGILGNFLGIFILYIITSILAADPYNGNMTVSIKYSIINIISSFLLAIFVALISSWIPISKTSKIPIKDLVLNSVEKKASNKKWKMRIGAASLVLSIILPYISPKSLGLIVNVFSMIVSIIGVVFLVPFITVYFLRLFEKLYSRVFGNEGILALKNLNNNKNILNNIALLAIGISVLLTINTISRSVGIEVLNAYKDWKFDIMVSINRSDRNAEQILRSIDGVDSTYGAYETWNGVEVINKKYTIRYLQGIDIKKYRDYVDFRIEGKVDDDEIFRQLDESRNILVAHMAKERLGIKVGDELTLEMNAGNKTYRVIGFFDSIMSNGSNAIISQKYYKTDMQQSYFNRFLVKTSKNPDEVLKSIQEKFLQRGVWGDTIKIMEQNNQDSNNQFMIILQAFSVIAMLIGVFGVFNNYMISFIERKRSIAILRSVGLSKKQTLKMIFVEALTGGCIGGVAGIIGGIFILRLVPQLMQTIDVPIALHYSLVFFINALFGGIVIAVLASISPALKTSKLNIIEAVKYE